MGLDVLASGNQQTRDEIGSEPAIQPIVIVRSLTIGIEQLPRKNLKSTIGHSWICGSSTNGIVGTNIATQDGQQQVVGGAGKVETIASVNPINNHIPERFSFTTFKDVANTTGTWAGNGQLILTAAQIATSLSYSYNSGVISNLSIEITATSMANISKVEATADGGVHWKELTSFTNGQVYQITDTGTDFRIRLTASGNTTITACLININNLS